MTMMPTLVAVAHGTRDPQGPPVVQSLMGKVAARLPRVDVVTSYVELVQPTVAAVMEHCERPAVMVPLLLSTGHHVTVDLPTAAAAAPAQVSVAGHLGPHPSLARVLSERLQRAGARGTDAVVLAAAGSTHAAGIADTEKVAGMLDLWWSGPVSVGYLSAAQPTVSEAVAAARRAGHERVFVAPYLLAPGRFSRAIGKIAMEAGAAGVSEVLGDHRLIVDLVCRRYLLGCADALLRPAA